MLSHLTPTTFNISFQNSNLEAIGAYINELEACDSNVQVHDYFLVKFDRPFVVVVIYSYRNMETTNSGNSNHNNLQNSDYGKTIPSRRRTQQVELC